MIPGGMIHFTTKVLLTPGPMVGDVLVMLTILVNSILSVTALVATKDGADPAGTVADGAIAGITTVSITVQPDIITAVAGLPIMAEATADSTILPSLMVAEATTHVPMAQVTKAGPSVEFPTIAQAIPYLLPDLQRLLSAAIATLGAHPQDLYRAKPTAMSSKFALTKPQIPSSPMA